MSRNIFLEEAMVWISNIMTSCGMISLGQRVSKSLAISQSPMINLTAKGYSKQGDFIRATRLCGPSVQVRSPRV